MENLIKEIKNQVESILVDNQIEGFQPGSEPLYGPIKDLDHDPQYSVIEIDADDYSSLEVESILGALVKMKYVYKDYATITVRRDDPWSKSNEEIVVVSVISGYKKLENKNWSKGWLFYELDLGLWDRKDAQAPEVRREGVEA